MTRIAVHWRHFGPYHRARLAAARAYFQNQGMEIIGLEVAGGNITYPWEQSTNAGPLASYTIFPDAKYERISWPKAALGVIKALERLKPDAVAMAGYVGGDVGGILAWCHLRGRPAILMSESKEDDAPRYFIKERIKGVIVQRFAAAICGGRLHRNYLQKLGLRSSQISLGYDAVDNCYFRSEADRHRANPQMARRLPGLTDAQPYFLASSRFVARKNLDRLLDAYARYRQQMSRGPAAEPPWRLIILGDGPDRARLERSIDTSGLAGICLPGFRQINELPAYYAHAQAFIHPALQEQWGLVVNEAMASGLPVLLSERCGCVPELVASGQNGFTFDPEDVEEMSGLMVKLSREEPSLTRMGQASYQIVRHWGVERFAQGLSSALAVALSDE